MNLDLKPCLYCGILINNNPSYDCCEPCNRINPLVQEIDALRKTIQGLNETVLLLRQELDALKATVREEQIGFSALLHHLNGKPWWDDIQLAKAEILSSIQ